LPIYIRQKLLAPGAMVWSFTLWALLVFKA
jgi:hypothetical protein